MTQIRKRLTYANVMSSLAVFLVLGGATAFAVSKALPKKSVGAKQLKTNAVSTAKIKKNAVTKPKIKDGAVDGPKIADGAVDGAKIADGSVSGAEINAASTPFSRIVHRARTTTAQAVTGAFQPYPLGGATYTQLAGEDDQFLGALDVTFAAGCTQPRTVQVGLVLDAANPAVFNTTEAVGFGFVTDTGAGAASRRVEIGAWPAIGSGTRFAPASDTGHTLSLFVLGTCSAGAGITATAGGVDVIGTK